MSRARTRAVRRRLLRACAAGTVASLGLLCTRMAVASDTQLWFLSWNLLLAWIPLLVAALAGRVRRRVPHALGLGAWLLLFPNTPYPVTDLIHLRYLDPSLRPLDVTLLAMVAATSLLLAGINLAMVREQLSDRHGAAATVAAMDAIALLSGLGIYIGRVLQWNSWDVLVRPAGRLATLARHLASPEQLPRAVVISAGGAALVAVLERLSRDARAEPLGAAGRLSASSG